MRRDGISRPIIILEDGGSGMVSFPAPVTPPKGKAAVAVRLWMARAHTFLIRRDQQRQWCGVLPRPHLFEPDRTSEAEVMVRRDRRG